jgi:hypothetical protein
MVPVGLQVAELAVLPDQLPWAEVRLAPGAWGAWAGARRASAEAALLGWRVAGAGKLAALARDARALAARQWGGRAWDDPARGEPGGLRLPWGSPPAPAALEPYRPDAGRFAAQSCGAAELRARLAAEPELVALRH